jgi:hypothetical protein
MFSIGAWHLKEDLRDKTRITANALLRYIEEMQWFFDSSEEQTSFLPSL